MGSSSNSIRDPLHGGGVMMAPEEDGDSDEY
jgi:hypothetical protein